MRASAATERDAVRWQKNTEALRGGDRRAAFWRPSPRCRICASVAGACRSASLPSPRAALPSPMDAPAGKAPAYNLNNPSVKRLLKVHLSLSVTSASCGRISDALGERCPFPFFSCRRTSLSVSQTQGCDNSRVAPSVLACAHTRPLPRRSTASCRRRGRTSTVRRRWRRTSSSGTSRLGGRRALTLRVRSLRDAEERRARVVVATVP